VRDVILKRPGGVKPLEEIQHCLEIAPIKLRRGKVDPPIPSCRTGPNGPSARRGNRITLAGRRPQARH
jgi:hypothetical protein